MPREYSDLQVVFSRERDVRLPPHQLWDYAIKLLPNAMPPKNKVYSLSLLETKAMEEYIREALSAGLIRPSTSLAAAGFFFVEKKGWWPVSLHRLLRAECYHCPLSVSSPISTCSPGTITWSRIFSKAGFTECLQSHLNQGSRRLENGIPHNQGTL